MKPMELVELIKNDKPELLGKMPEKRIAALVREVLSQLRQTIEEMEDGTVKIVGLGSFSVRHVEREKDGQKISKKVIVFRAAKSA